MPTIVTVHTPTVKTTFTLTADNARAVGEAFQFGVIDGRKGDDADSIFFTGELGVAYRLGFAAGAVDAQIKADEALNALNVWM